MCGGSSTILEVTNNILTMKNKVDPESFAEVVHLEYLPAVTKLNDGLTLVYDDVPGYHNNAPQSQSWQHGSEHQYPALSSIVLENVCNL